MDKILMSYRVMGNAIIEKITGYVVYKTNVVGEATRMCRSLNLGGGFNGITPDFFCLEYPVVGTKKPSTK